MIAVLRHASLYLALATVASACVLASEVDPDAMPDAGVTSTSTSGAGGEGGTAGAGGEGGTDPGGCKSDAMCNDGKVCTADTCQPDGTCSFGPADAGVSCADADACNGAEACDGAGQCAPGAPLVVDDADLCTADACDAVTGHVSHVAPPDCVSWKPTSATGAPIPRYRHTAVWDGSRMIVWGGSIQGAPPVTATGGLYDPATDTWTPTSTVGAPSPRSQHQAVWTGSKMIVWGGYDDVGFTTAGGIYDPAADTWTPMSTAGAPSGRVTFSMVWTGKKVVVWGGFNTTFTGSGASYDVASDTWTTLPSSGAPTPRFAHTGLWAYDRMIIWGGQNTFDWQNDGRIYLPALGASGTWIGATSPTNTPEFREAHTVVWTGNRMLLWGGWNGGPFLDTGASFDPSAGVSGTWTPTATDAAPSPRRDHRAVWAGKEMFVFGGCGGEACVDFYDDGGRYLPDFGAGSWRPIAAHPDLGPRKDHTMIWSGSEVIVWGGRKGPSGGLDTGARVAP